MQNVGAIPKQEVTVAVNAVGIVALEFNHLWIIHYKVGWELKEVYFIKIIDWNKLAKRIKFFWNIEEFFYYNHYDMKLLKNIY